MYAILAHGGKQYRVAPGETVRLERIPGSPGDQVELKQVLLVADEGKVRLGQDAGTARVVATVLRQDRGPKIIIFKKKRCKQYRRTNGHRQDFTELRVERIG